MIRANWNESQLDFLRKHRIKCFDGGVIHIDSSEKYAIFKNELSDVKLIFNRLSGVIFDKEEFDNSKNYMCHNTAASVAVPLELDNDYHFYLDKAFGDYCVSCNNIPTQEQIGPLIFEREPTLPKRSLWGGYNGIGGYLLTDKEKYKLLKNKWGFSSREILIGKNEMKSKNFVQLDIDISPSSLAFGDSLFGKTVEDHPDVCHSCNRTLYSNSILDFFPTFEHDFNFDIVLTQEWFGWFKRLVVSRRFAHWMVENGFAKMSSSFFIPTQKFEV